MEELELDGDIIFCNDGILRLKTEYSDKIISYPLKDIQDKYNRKDIFILKFLNRTAHIEQGTKLSDIICSLEPWAEIMSLLTNMDIKSYVNACAIESAKQDFASIILHKGISIYRAYEFRKMNEKESFSDYLNDTDRGTKTSNFNSESRLRANGYFSDNEQGYSLTGSDFTTLSQTPVLLSKTNTNIFSEGDISPFNDIDGVKGYDKYGEFQTVDSYSMIDIIKAIFVDGLFFQTPLTGEAHENFCNILNKSIQDLEKEKAEEENANDNVVSLFSGEKITSTNEKEEEESKDNNIKSVKIAPGAFDDIVSHYKVIDDENCDLFHYLSKSSSIKFGELKLAEQ